MADMSRGTVLITGGSLGLGYETALELAKRQPTWSVIIAARTKADLEVAAEKIRQESGNQQIIPIQLDLSSAASVRALVEQIQKRADLPPLRAVVCNAGLQIVGGTKRSVDGYEMTFAINHLGHYLLTRLLLNTLVAPARIIFLGSSTHDPAQKSGLPDPVYTSAEALSAPVTPTEDAVTVGRRRYATSKLLNILNAYELSRQLKRSGKTGVSVNIFDPGLMPGSGLAREYSPLAQFFWKRVMQAMIPFRPNWSSTRISGRNLARLVLDPEFGTQPDRYYGIVRKQMKPIESSVDSHNPEFARDLWDASARMVGLPAAL